MITTNVPRLTGLDIVVQAILDSDNPVQAIADDLGQHFLREWEVQAVALGSLWRDRRVGEIVKERVELPGRIDKKDPYHMGFTLALLQAGLDYLDAPLNELIRSFYWGTHVYHFADTSVNGINPSFAVALYPEKTTTAQEMVEMKRRYENHSTVHYDFLFAKTLLLSDGKTAYLVVMPDNHILDRTALMHELRIGRNGFDRLRMDRAEPREIIGREMGMVGPMPRADKFANVNAILFSTQMLVPYSEIHYAFPIDRRASLVLADTRDFVKVLREVDGFPEIRTAEISVQRAA